LPRSHHFSAVTRPEIAEGSPQARVMLGFKENSSMRRILAALALSGALVLGGCQNPDGSTNWGNTLLLGAGVGAAAALVAGAASDGGRPRHYSQNYRRAPGHARGGYRGW
jgi:hypothetical protein